MSTPRPVPDSRVPAIGGTLVVAARAARVPRSPAGGSAPGASRRCSGSSARRSDLLLQRLPLGMGSLASSGVVAFGRMFRAVGVGGGPDRRRRLGLRPRASRRRRVRARVHGRVRARRCWRTSEGRQDLRSKLNRLVVALVGLALLAPASASAASFDPSSEFALKDWVPIHLGGLDLSINKAVVYLLVGAR